MRLAQTTFFDLYIVKDLKSHKEAFFDPECLFDSQGQWSVHIALTLGNGAQCLWKFIDRKRKWPFEEASLLKFSIQYYPGVHTSYMI